MVFLESMAGVSPHERVTDSQLYNVLHQQLLLAALSGSPAKQAPRSPHSHARRTGTPDGLRPDASLISGFCLVAPDPELDHAQVLGSQGHPAKQCEDRRDGFLLSSTHQVKDPGSGPHSRLSTARHRPLLLSGRRRMDARRVSAQRHGRLHTGLPHPFSVFQQARVQKTRAVVRHSFSHAELSLAHGQTT